MSLLKLARERDDLPLRRKAQAIAKAEQVMRDVFDCCVRARLRGPHGRAGHDHRHGEPAGAFTHLDKPKSESAIAKEFREEQMMHIRQRSLFG